jgi:hypothetical protein
MRIKDLYALAKYYLRRRFRHDGRRVLDVGSGHRPHQDATHLLELLPEDDSERGKPMKRLGRALVIANVEAIPFKDGSFDFIYAAHVLEHVQKPSNACREIMRVGRAGYIETPSPFYEQGYNYPHADRGWSFHRWFVFVEADKTLIFEPKTRETVDRFCQCRYAHFVKGLYEKAGDLNRLHKVLPHECNNTVFRWAGRFDFEVRDSPKVLAS